MRLFVGAIAVVISCLVPSAAAAETVVYEGHVKGSPATTFNLDFRTPNNGLKLRYFTGTGSGFTVSCDDGPHVLNLSAGPFDSGAKVVDGRFNARLDSGTHHVRVRGEVKPNGKAIGTFRYKWVSASWGACTTGLLDWVAHK